MEKISPLNAPFIFFFVLIFQLFDKFLSDMKKKANVNEKDVQLRAEIKQLLKEAATLSEPSTFAQSAKLKRLAAAKERELTRTEQLFHCKSVLYVFQEYLVFYLLTLDLMFKIIWPIFLARLEIVECRQTITKFTWHAGQESASKKIKPKLVLFEKMLIISKVLTYLTFIVWFWRIPVATISTELVQPFGRFLSLKTGRSFSDTVMVGIIPWLILSNRVGKYFCDIIAYIFEPK